MPSPWFFIAFIAVGFALVIGAMSWAIKIENLQRREEEKSFFLNHGRTGK